MKKIILMAMAAAAVSACSKSEPTPQVEGQKEKLNILTSVGGTRAVVTGTTMPQGSAIGVHVTQGSGPATAYKGENYVAGGDNLEFGDNVRFDNTADASKWVSETAASAAANLMIGAEEGTVYAYYPYTATVTGVGTAATIPAAILASGDITTSTTGGAKHYDATEVDYLYYEPASARNTVSSATTATTPLTMEHAMASVSFRMYVSADAPVVSNGDNKYYLMGYTIKNKTSKTLFVADNTGVTMNIADGTITTTQTGGTITRTLNGSTGYALTRVAAANADAPEKDAMIWFSNLTFPITAIAHSTVNGLEISDDIEIVFSIKKGLNGTAENYTVDLVVDTTAGSDKWEAGKNYQYTVKLNAFSKLGIEQVTVTEWVDVVGGDITID